MRRVPVPSPLLRVVLLVVAGLSLAIGVVGLLVPGLPGPIFVLIAGWAAARSSTRFHAWLEAHRVFGPPLRNWRENRSVSRAARWSATGGMALSSVILFATNPRPWLAEAATAVMVVVAVWIWRRPLPRASHVQATEP
jgi:uncharacterized membrane protein YbaN (DUF454 family)